MNLAIQEARAAAGRDEVPIGAVLVREGMVIGRAGNRTRELNDPTAHAEIGVIRDACKMAGAQRIPGCDLYVTIEPCAMCAAAISFARVRKLVFGAFDAKGGAVESGGKFYTQATCHHKPEVKSGVLAEECGAIMKEFFAKKREK